VRLSDSRSFSWIEGCTGVEEKEAEGEEEEGGEERLLRADLRRVRIYWLIGKVKGGGFFWKKKTHTCSYKTISPSR